MKKILLIIAIGISANGFCQLTKSIIKVQELNYGITVSDSVFLDSLSTALSGKVNIHDGIHFISKTDSIVSKLGLSFGTSFILKSPFNTNEEISIVWIYPIAIKGKKKVSYVRRRPTNRSLYLGYTFDISEEIVQGIWILEFYHRSTLLYHREFLVK